MKNKMNKDYSYCVGCCYSDLSGHLNLNKLCKNCRRYISYDKYDEVEWWTYVQYDRKTGKCPMYEPKAMSARIYRKLRTLLKSINHQKN